MEEYSRMTEQKNQLAFLGATWLSGDEKSIRSRVSIYLEITNAASIIMIIMDAAFFVGRSAVAFQRTQVASTRSNDFSICRSPSHGTEGPPRIAHSKRSRFMTLSHAETKSWTNFVCESSEA